MDDPPYGWEEAHTVVLASGHPAKHAALWEKVTGEKLPNDNFGFSAASEREKTLSSTVPFIPPQLDLFESAIASCF
jgi:hypothetical protein